MFYESYKSGFGERKFKINSRISGTITGSFRQHPSRDLDLGLVLTLWDGRLKKIQEREKAQGITPETEGAINLPNAAVAQTFSVQSIDYPHPLAVQEVHRWDKEQSKNLTEWCPESILCSKEPFKDT